MVKLSIALVTRNRPESLERTLNSLYRQSIRPFEVVVSDDSTNDNYSESNKRIVEKFNFIYLKGPNKGLYANRNFVASKCTGTHIRTMDDDHEFPIDHIYECLNAISSEPKTIWTIGEYYPTETIFKLPAPIPGQLHPRGFSYVPKNMNSYFGISCGATIYPKSVIERNLFNSELYQFGMLYLEYGARLLKNNYCIKFLKSTYIIHHYDESNRSIPSLDTSQRARLFSMLMLSFSHNKSTKNIFLTILQIIYELLAKKYSIKMLNEVYKDYKNSSSFM